MANDPINLYDFEARAELALPHDSWDFIEAGAMDELTTKRNRSAFDQLTIRPRFMRSVEERKISTTMLGDDLNFPVFSRSIWSMGFPRLLEVVAKEVPVTCCGLRVDPGDIVVADIDGVAVVPQGQIEEVKRQVERIHTIEKEVKERREKGESMSELFPLLAKKFTAG